MIVINNDAGGLCNRLRLMAHVIATGIETNTDVQHLYFSDIAPKLSLDSSTLPIKVDIPNTPIVKKKIHHIARLFIREVKKVFSNSNPSSSDQKNKEIIDKIKSTGNGTITSWNFRNWRAFYNFQPEIAAFLSPNDEVRNYADSVISSLKKENSNAILIAIHIRRGDYKDYRGGIFYYDDQTYLRWMTQIQNSSDKDVLFLVFSNERVCFSELPPSIQKKSIVYMNGSAIQDLSVMSKCDYIMGPPSTYSEWAAYLNNSKYLAVKSRESKVTISDFMHLSEYHSQHINR